MNLGYATPRDVPADLNFCWVYQLDSDDCLPTGFCFGPGHEIPMRMVDWFNPIPDATAVAMDNSGGMEAMVSDWSCWESKIEAFVRKKRYVRDDRRYIIVTKFGHAITFHT